MRHTHNILLEDPYVKWSITEQSPDETGPVVHGRGYAFIQDRFVEGQGFVDAVRESCLRKPVQEAITAVKELIPALNGSWALVVEWPDGHLVAAVDRLRSIPLFYAQHGHEAALSFSTYPLLDMADAVSIDEGAALEYLLAGYVMDDHTLYEGIRQIRAGEILEYDPACATQVKTSRYYRHLPGDYRSACEQELEHELHSIIKRVFSRYVRAFGGGQLAVPLSGGYDSRLIAAMFKLYGAQNVLCYSYGRPGNTEASISREVASALGYDWEFVEYDKDVWAQCMAKEDMESYWRYCGQGTAIPHLQDLPAVAGLSQTGKLSNATILPGHALDALAGSHIPGELCVPGLAPGPDATVNSVFGNHFVLWPGGEDAAQHLGVFERLRAALPADDYPAEESPWAPYEMWELDNRQAKFIANSVRLYEFCGQDWALPLWDYELMDFFLSVPPKLRWRQRLHVNTLGDKVFRGDLERLREIPRTTGEVLTERMTQDIPPAPNVKRQPSCFRSALRKALDGTGLLGMAHRLKAHLAQPDFLAFDCWFAEGKDPRRVSVGQVFEKFGVRTHLPPALWAILEPHQSLLLVQVFFNGVLSAVALASEYKRLNSGSRE